MPDDRREHLVRFYALLDDLERRIGGQRALGECSGRMDWPRRGVYFFREAGELRSDTGHGPRIVRVGTHALTSGSSTKLWTRLSQHGGKSNTGGGNHRGSIFRLIDGTALMARDGVRVPTWGRGSAATRDIVIAEDSFERAVSAVIWKMPFLWLAVDDEPGPTSLRGMIERNAIALLSNYNRRALDPPSSQWLGLKCDRERVRGSGLWNSNHVDESYDPSFLDELERLVSAMERA